jgi:hypothetical protein
MKNEIKLTALVTLLLFLSLPLVSSQPKLPNVTITFVKKTIFGEVIETTIITRSRIRYIPHSPPGAQINRHRTSNLLVPTLARQSRCRYRYVDYLPSQRTPLCSTITTLRYHRKLFRSLHPYPEYAGPGLDSGFPHRLLQ